MMKDNVFETKVWNSYASAYDDIALYYRPYKEIMDKIITFIKAKMIKGRILDAGCGTGELSARLSGMGYKVEAFDISGVMLKTLEKKIKKRGLKNIKIKQGDLNKKLAYINAGFNVVINVHSLFMLNDKWFSLSEFLRVLKKSGYFVLAHHKPVNVWEGMKKVIKTEGVINGMGTLLRLVRVGFYNLFLQQRHKNIYGHTSAKKIIDFMKKRKVRLLSREKLYNGFDDFLVFRKE
jgi:ubiquinone/menaquinone biosynthesis C-methylase UbiE